MSNPAQMSPLGRKFIEDAEGCKLTAYKDSRGIPTIGVGHTGNVDGKPIQLSPPTVITMAKCDELLAADLHDAQAAIELARVQRKAAYTQAQIDALISFAFNAGVGGFGTSSVRAAFVAGEDARVPHGMLQWTRAGADPTALASRRAREAFIYARGVYLDNDWNVIK
jgi:lysozyme